MDRAKTTEGPARCERSLTRTAHRWAIPLAGLWGISLATATGKIVLGPMLEVRIVMFMTVVAALPIAIARFKLATEQDHHPHSVLFGRALSLSLFAPVATLVEITNASSRSYAVASATIAMLALVLPVLARKGTSALVHAALEAVGPRIALLTSSGGIRR
jgi:hypothetical protein